MRGLPGSAGLRLVVLRLVFVLGLVIGCGEDAPIVPPDPPQPVAAAVDVAPSSATLHALGDTIRVTATVLDQNNRVMTGAVVTYSSNAAEVVEVDTTTGLVTAVGNGTAVVAATSGGATGTATVTVEQRVTEVRVTPGSVTMFTVGDSVWLVAEALDSNGHALKHARFTWSSDDTAVAHVDASGLVTASGEGNAVVTATRGEATASTAVTVTVLSGPVRDRAILEALYETTGGPGWSNNRAWLTDAPLDDWYGVDTDPEGRVVRLSLIANNLAGGLPPELGRLDELRHLRLDATLSYFLQCSRPFAPRESSAQYGNSSGRSRLTGAAENRYARSWLHRDVEDERYEVGLGADSPTHAFSRPESRPGSAGNRLMGRIPPELGDLTNLETLSVNGNELSGPIPRELGKLVNLKGLLLAMNRLTGSLPPELGDLTRLERLDLAVSHDPSLDPPRAPYSLSGALPAEFGKLVNLKELDLTGHGFAGSLPPEWGGLARLQYLSLACNSLTGPIPPALRQLGELRHMSLFGNQFQGEISPWLGELRRLEHVNLGSNWYLTGQIPASVGELAELVQLNLGDNRLSGPIPAELGRLVSLEDLSVDANQLTGALPPQLGNLANLEDLDINHNFDLTGPLPYELVQTPLQRFSWRGTGLCASRDSVFQAWLRSIRNHNPGGNCTLPPREVFAAFYEATGGSGWASDTNWLTDAPVSSWFGVTVEDSMVTALELPGNGLSGILPSAMANFWDLKRLDLSGNALTGPVQPELARLGTLERLDLADNQLDGPLPGVLTNLQSLSYFDWSESGACAPRARWFERWILSIATRSGPSCDGLFSLSFATAHLSQAAQDVGGAVPLIAGRSALVRVFATADRANDHDPIARAGFLLGGQEAHTVELALGSSRGLAEHFPGQPDQWHQAVIPAGVLRPEIEMVVQIDPDSVIPRTVLNEVRLPLDVRELPPMELTIVPVVTGSSEDSDVLDWIQSADDPPVEFMRAVLPVAELDLSIRDPLEIAGAPAAREPGEWAALLQGIELLRTTEGGTGYWYGVVNHEGGEGIRGVATVRGRVSLGVPDAEVFAHEVGHNMSLRHAPCGIRTRLDPDYPYRDGSIGVHGYDPRSGELLDPSTHDLMSYCHPQWISDYNFTKALEYRIQSEAPSAAVAATGDQPRGSRLLLWGQLSAEGELQLDPAFALDAPAQLPSGSGPYRVEAFSGDGTRALALDFEMETVSEGGGSFLFLVPLAQDVIAGLERIVLSGPEGTTALERETRASPVAIVMDRATGRIRSILRGEAAQSANATVAADARSETVPRERVLVSYGLPGPAPR